MIFNLQNPYEAQNFKDYCNRLYTECMKSQLAIVEVKRRQRPRSTSQNAYLHVCLGYYASEFGYSLEEVKIDLYKKQLNKDIYERTRINKRGQEVTYIRSSTDLDVAEMSLSIERFRNYSAGVAGLYIPEPHETDAYFAAVQQIERYKEYL